MDNEILNTNINTNTKKIDNEEEDEIINTNTNTNTKKMVISGKNNIYKIKELINGSIKKVEKDIRLTMKNFKDDDALLKQVQMINKMYMQMDNADTNENENENDKLLRQELEKKINGYKQQDIKKGMHNSIGATPQLITFHEVVEKLVSSKLKCYYCSCNVLLLYKNVREPMQWTLDRKYNDDCHSNENTLIACLKCNLERRVKNVDKFTFTKKLRINKEM